MNSLKTVAAKVKRSPQILRKKFAGPSYDNLSHHQELREDSLHDVGPLKDGIPFYCKWLGTCQVFKAQGTGCTNVAVKKIVDDTRKAKNSREGCKLQKVLLIVTTRNLRIEDMVTKVPKLEVPIYRISYCTADPDFPKVFAFIAREKGSKILQCYALLCNKESMAKAISLTVADAFSLAYDSYDDLSPSKEDPVSQTNSNADEPSTSKPVSLLLLSQNTNTSSSENGTTSTHAQIESNIKGTKNPFHSQDEPQESSTNPFLRIKEDRTALPRRPLSEYSGTAPEIKITGDEFLASASGLSFDSSVNMKALDLARPIDDDFEDEFTRLAECRSNPNLFELETPVRKSDLHDDVATLIANEETAKALMNSQSTEDLLFG